MAIRRIDPKATFKVISQFDEALVSETDEEMKTLQTLDEKGNTVYNPTRYEQYLDTLDETKLVLKEGLAPSYFVIRCLKNSEVAELNQRFITVDVEAKRIDHVNRNLMFLEHFNMGCLGIDNEGRVEKVTGDEIGYAVAVSMGSVISLFTSLGKHLKK